MLSTTRKRIFWALLPACMCGACTAVGTIGDAADAPVPGATGSSGAGANAVPADGGDLPRPSAGGHPLQRLAADELTNSMRDLFAPAAVPPVSMPNDGVNESGFLAPGVTSESDVRSFLQASETVVASLTGSAWTTLLGCTGTALAGSDACAQAFIARVGKRAYRRPLTTDEATRLHALYAAQTAAGAGGDDALHLVLQAILNSPSFLYHTEGFSTPTVQDHGQVKLGGYEVASRLSYFLTRTMPDNALFAAAEDGTLDTVDGIAAQTHRLLATPAARATVAEFGAEWLGTDAVSAVSKDTGAYPQFDATLRASMQAETRAYFDYVVFDGDRSWITLMTAPFSMIDAPLAKYYGVALAPGSGFQKAELDPTQRFGFLTQGAVLAVQSNPSLESPIFRGKLIQTKLLCRDIPPPPKAFPPPQPPSGQPMTVRQVLDREHATGGCNSCHGMLDPPGYAFGNYDAIGQIQSIENGLPVDTTGTMTLPSGETLAFASARDVVRGIAHSDDGSDCFTRQWFRFALQRRETSTEAAVVAGSRDAFVGSSFDIQGLMVSVATSQAFRYRAVQPGEVLP